MATKQEMVEATEILLNEPQDDFFGMRKVLDLRMPQTVFSSEQEIELWNTMPKNENKN